MFLSACSLIFLLALSLPLIIFAGSAPLAAQAVDTGASGGTDAASKRPSVVFETNRGNFTVELYTDLAPKTSENFLSLVNKNFYNGTIFHRVISDFMIQGGDPTGTGTGGPGYVIPDEFGAGLTHGEPGILSMANAGPDSGGSQFFITLVPTKWLDGKHAIFGRVTDGLDVVQAIGKTSTSSSDRPLEDVVIKTITVKEEPKPADAAADPTASGAPAADSSPDGAKADGPKTDGAKTDGAK